MPAAPFVRINHMRFVFVSLLVRPAGYLLTWDSTFSSDRSFYFGDQEEMGLGIRVATPIRVERGDGGSAPARGHRRGRGPEWRRVAGGDVDRHGSAVRRSPGFHCQNGMSVTSDNAGLTV